MGDNAYFSGRILPIFLGKICWSCGICGLLRHFREPVPEGINDEFEAVRDFQFREH